MQWHTPLLVMVLSHQGVLVTEATRILVHIQTGGLVVDKLNGYVL